MDKSEIDIINDCCGRFRKNSQLAINTYNNDMKQYCVLRFIIDFLPDKKLFTTTDIQIRVENSNDDWVREHNWTSGVSGHMKIVYEFMSKIGMMVKSPGERAAFNYNFTDLYNKYRLNGVEWVYIWEALKKYWREQKLEAKQKKDIPEVVKDIRELIDRLDDLDKQVINLDDQINANDLRLTELEVNPGPNTIITGEVLLPILKILSQLTPIVVQTMIEETEDAIKEGKSMTYNFGKNLLSQTVITKLNVGD